MLKRQQKQILELLQTLDEAHDELEQLTSPQLIIGLLSNCQDFASEIIGFIEEIKGSETETASLIEEYFQILYNASLDSDIKKHVFIIKNQLFKIKNCVTYELVPNKIEIAFFPYKASMFDAFESIWLEAENDPFCDVYVVPIPYYDKANGVFVNMHYEGAEYPDYVPLTDWREYDVEARRPDVVFIHNPYDDSNYMTSVHPDYYSRRLRGLTDLLVYVPYFVSDTDVGKNSVTTCGCVFAHKTIVQSEKIRQTYIRVYNEFSKSNGFGSAFGTAENKFISLGSPKFDKVINSKQEDFTPPEQLERLIMNPDGSRKKVILYNTTVGTVLTDNTRVLDKLRYVFGVFSKRKDVVLWWRPHPLNKTAYQSMRPHLLNEYNAIVEQYKQAGFGIYDDAADLHRAISFADAYYGEGGSLITLFSLTGKPIMLQNVDILGEGKGLINPYYYGIPTEYGEYFWTNLVFYNAMIKVDKRNMEVVQVVPIPNNRQLRSILFRKSVIIEDKLVLVPSAADYIAVFDISVNSFSQIDFEIPSEYLKIKINKEYRFLDGFAFKDDVFFAPCSFPAIVKMNIKTGQLDYYSDWLEATEKFPDVFSNFRFISCIQVGQCLLMPCINANVVVIFDMEKCESKVCRIGTIDNGFLSIRFDGQYYWMTQMKNNHVVVRWKREDNTFVEYDEFPKEFIGGVFPFANPIFDGKKIWLLPYSANMAFSIDVKEGTFTRQTKFETECEPGTDSLPVAALLGNQIIAQAYKRNNIVKYDISSGIIEENELKISLENSALLDDIISKCTIESGYVLQNYRYLEVLNSDILEFLDKLMNGDIGVNDNQRNYYGKTISNSDGTAGKTIYSYCKDLAIKS